MRSFKKRRMEQRRAQILSSIESLVKKRRRSEYALLDCLLCNVKLDPEDVKYFNYYTSEIRVLEEELAHLERALAALDMSGKAGCPEM